MEDSAVVILEEGVFEISLCSPIQYYYPGIEFAACPPVQDIATVDVFSEVAALSVISGLVYRFQNQTDGTDIETFQVYGIDYGVLSWFYVGRFEAGARLLFSVPPEAGNVYSHVLQAPRMIVRQISL